MTLSELSIKNSVFAWMLMSFLILFGWISFSRMGISEMPDVDFPVVTVEVTYEGAAPEIVEADIVDIIEEAVISVQGIRSLSSSAKQEQATISIEFDLDRDIDVALQEVNTKISQAIRRLPSDIDPPIVTKSNPEDQPIMWVALSADKPIREIIEFARDHVKDQLQTVKNVGEIILGGYIEPNLRLWIDPDKLARYELTVKDVIDAVAREHIEVPAGRIETHTVEFNIRALGEAMTAADFAEIVIRKRGGQSIYQPIRIGDVATVEEGLDEIRRISRSNGKPAIGLGIKKQRGSNAVEVADGIKVKLDSLRPGLPESYALTINFDSTTFVKASIGQLKHDLLLAAVLTSAVCLLFLGSWQATANVLLAIPTSTIGAFIFLHALGFTLNTFTLLGLILAIGIVVDDAIMVLENIVRHKEMGKAPIPASLDGSKEITGAAIAATIAILAIFIPVVFMEGILGKFFFQFGITISAAVALSLLEALTLTPMRASRFLREHDKKSTFARRVDRSYEVLSRIYQRLLHLCLNARWVVIGGALCTFIASLALFPGLRKEFVPAQDQSSFLIRAQTPLGSSLAFTDERLQQAEKILATHAEIVRYYTAVGGFGGGDVNTGVMFITLVPPKQRPSQADVMAALRRELSAIPDLRIVIQDLSTRGFTAQRGFPVEFGVRGPDWHTLTRISQTLLAQMQKNPYFLDVDTDYKYGQPEIQIAPRRDAARRRGVSIEDIGQTIQAMMGGVRVGKFTEAGRRNDIRVRLREEARQNADDIRKLQVRNDAGELISLGELVDIHEQKTLKSITRKDRERAIGIFANVSKGYSQDKAMEEVTRLADGTLPPGYRLVFTGSSQTFKESFQSLFFVLMLGIAVSYMVLASQFNSFIHPLIILLALPFSVSGAFVALRLTDHSLNIYSFIGLILLMGIVKKNSILLVDFTNQRRREGLSVRDALLTACPQRLRPILMTSVATLAAAIPPALALGPGSETRIPMAVVVLGGVLASTVLTLFVVPCAYSLMTRFERKPETHS